ncbi:MAG: co-chaperone GroES [Methanobrevibacter sp.]|nr:co-chaperone GroES [Methanobrevibacter sp.]
MAKLLDDKMLLKNLTETTAGGLYIPQIVQIAYSLFEIVQMGKGHYDKRIDKVIPLPKGLKVGDRVLVNVGVLKPIVINGEKLYTCPNAEEAILILDDDERIA